MALKVGAATVGYCAMHSLFATRKVKALAAQVFGERGRNGWYRALYSGQALGGLGVLLWFIGKQDDREVYRARGVWAWLLRGGQGLGFVIAALALKPIGVGQLSGIANVWRWLKGQKVEASPEAQGPVLENEKIKAEGPFRWTRNPLNFAFSLVFCLPARMTRNRLVFSGVILLYNVLGSVVSERRLKAAYGAAFSDYQKSGVPFFLPRPPTAAPPETPETA